MIKRKSIIRKEGIKVMSMKEWFAVEAAKELLDPKNVKNEVVAEIGSRYPVFTKMVLTDGTQSLLHILAALPKVTADTIEKGLRGTGAKAADKKKAEPEEEEEAEKPKASTAKKKPGRPAKASTKAKAEEPEAEEEEGSQYAGKSAKELYTMCKERGLSVKMKQPASVYAKLLMKDDAASDDPADDEDWGEDEEVEEEKPEKKTSTKKKAGRPAAKKKAEPEPEEEADDEEDDDDDWEL